MLLAPVIDKTEFSRQMDNSRVVRKEVQKSHFLLHLTSNYFTLTANIIIVLLNNYYFVITDPLFKMTKFACINTWF